MIISVAPVVLASSVSSPTEVINRVLRSVYSQNGLHYFDGFFPSENSPIGMVDSKVFNFSLRHCDSL